MKPLPLNFKRAGFTFDQLRRMGDVVLLAKSKPHSSTRSSYEVCRVRRCPERTIAGKIIPAHESLPPDEAWGTYGWTHTSLDSAMAKFAQLITGRHAAHALSPDAPPFSTATLPGAPKSPGNTKTAEPPPELSWGFGANPTCLKPYHAGE